MSAVVKYFFLLVLLLAGASSVSGQSFKAALEGLRERSDEAMFQHNLPLYLKLANEEYRLTTQQRDTVSMIRSCIKLVDYYTNINLNNDSANAYRNKGLYWARLKKDVEHETDFRNMQALQYVKNGNYVKAYALYQSLDSIISNNDFDFAPYYHTSYADLLLYLDKNDEAIARIKMAAEGFATKRYAKCICDLC